MEIEVIVATHCFNIGNRGHCNPVATVGAEVIVGTHCGNSGNRGHCLLTVTSDHIATVILDTIVALDTVVVFGMPFEKE
jgi:hypothetical protein